MEAADERVALDAAVGEIAAGTPGLSRWLQLADAAGGQRARRRAAAASCGATASNGRKPWRRRSCAGSTRTPTIARTFERHCQQRSLTVRRRAGRPASRPAPGWPAAGPVRRHARIERPRAPAMIRRCPLVGPCVSLIGRYGREARAQWGICAFSAPKTANRRGAFDERSDSAAQRRMPARPSRTSTSAAKSCVAETASHACGEHLAGVRRGGERDPRGLALLEAQAHVLEHVLELEQRRVVVLAHRARPSGRASREPPLPAPMTCTSASRSTPVPGRR